MNEDVEELELKSNLREVLNEESLELEEVAEGLNKIYRIYSDASDYILKIWTNSEMDEERFRAEPKIYELVNNNTDTPSPKLIYEDLDSQKFSKPVFILERIDGENVGSVKEQLEKEELVKLASQYGEILADIHDNISFDEYGLAAEEGNGLETMSNYNTWTEYLENMINEYIEHVENEWENPPKIDRELLLDSLTDLPEKPRSVLGHMDNRWDNIIAQSSQIKGFIDWGYTVFGHREYDLVRAEYLLASWDLSSRCRETQNAVRTNLRESYAENSDWKQDKGFEKSRGIYRCFSVLWIMAGLPNWGSDLEKQKYLDFEEDLANRMEEELDYLRS